MHKYNDPPPHSPVPSQHGCVSEIPDRVLETTFFISWSPEAELEAPKRHLSLPPPLPLALPLVLDLAVC